MARIQVDNLSVSFGTTPVLKGLSFSVESGRCLALLGSSGCGKSTLLNVVAGFLRPGKGSISCEDERLADAAKNYSKPVHSRGFGLVFQDFSLWPHMNVFENVAYGLRRARIRGSELRDRVERELQRVGMEGFLNAHPQNLSGGQQQRVAIARALVVRPRLLLLDEPLSALDARLRDELREEIARLIRQTGVTTLYVTHDQVEALTVADEVALMRGGRFEQLGTPDQVYRQPATAYAARFLGRANCLDLERKDGALAAGGFELPRSLSTEKPDQHCLVVRREALQLRDHLPVTGLHWGPVTCESFSYLGDRYEVSVRTEGGHFLRLFSESAPVPGRSYWLAVQAKELRILPRDAEDDQV